MVSIRNQWPVGVFVKCGSNERLSLRGASTNEHFFEMPMKSHQRTSAWMTESMNQWKNELMTERKERHKGRNELVGVFFSQYIGNFIIPTDEVIFFRGVGIPPTGEWVCKPFREVVISYEVGYLYPMLSPTYPHENSNDNLGFVAGSATFGRPPSPRRPSRSEKNWLN